MSFWDDVVVAAIFGKLGRADEGRPHLERLALQKPDFAGRARGLFRRALKIEPLIDDLIDGLRMAGMTIDSGSSRF
jgi:hypothetical protein